MDKKPLNDENEFYRGYEETTQTYLNENEKVEFVPKHDFGDLKKKSFILILLMTVPMAVCFAVIFWSFDFFIKLPVLSEILQRFYRLLGIVAGFALATFVVKNISLDDEKKDIVNRHVIHFMGFAAVSWIAIECIDAYENRNSQVMENTYRGLWALIPLAIAVGLIIWGYCIYTKLERKLFIPVMCVTVLFTGGMIVRDIVRHRFDVESYSVDYYFVSYEEIEPKSQNAEYYITDKLNQDNIQDDSYMGFNVFGEYEYFQNCLNRGGLSYYYCDENTEDILKDILGNDKNSAKYDEKFFEENYLVISMAKYYGSPKKYEVGRIFIDSDTMKKTEKYFYKEDHEGDDMTEYCLAFITIPKAYDIKYLSGGGSVSEYYYNQ